MPAGAAAEDAYGRRRWLLALAVLAGVRLAIPLLTLAFSGHALPGPGLPLPSAQRRPFGFYDATVEFISSLGASTSRAAACRCARRRRNGCAEFAVAAIARPPVDRCVAAGRRLGLAVTLPIHQMHPPGAAVFGWPLIWALPLIPIRAVGLLTPNGAFWSALS